MRARHGAQIVAPPRQQKHSREAPSGEVDHRGAALRGDVPGRLFVAGIREALLDPDPDVGHIMPASLDVLFQATADESFHAGSRALLQEPPVGVREQHVGPGVRGGGAAEGAPPGQHLEQHASERPDVRTPVHRTAARLLGAHVRGGAEDRPGRRRGRNQCRGRGDVPLLWGRLLLEGLRQTEIENFHRPVRADLDVARFEVPVDDSLRVGRFERFCDLSRDLERFGRGESPLGDPGVQRGALDQFHDDAEDAVALLHAVDRRDVRVIERCEDLRFASETGHAVGGGGESRGKNLEGHVPVEAVVRGAVNLPHAPRTDLADEPVVCERRACLEHGTVASATSKDTTRGGDSRCTGSAGKGVVPGRGDG